VPAPHRRLRRAAAVVALLVLLASACGDDDDRGAGGGAEAEAVASLCASQAGVALALDALGPALDADDPAAVEAALRQAQAALRGATSVELAVLDPELPDAVTTFADAFDDLVAQAEAVGFAPDQVTDLVNELGGDAGSAFTAADVTISSVAAARCGDAGDGGGDGGDGGTAATGAAGPTTSTVPADPAEALVAGILGATPYAGADEEACVVAAVGEAFTDDQLAGLDQAALAEADAAALGSAFEGCLPYRAVLADGLARELDPTQVDCVLGALGEVTWTTAFADAADAQAALDQAIAGCVPATEADDTSGTGGAGGTGG
jgi:hypothetical protein